MSDVMVDGGCAWRLAMMPLEFGFPLKAVTETLSPPCEPVRAHACLPDRGITASPFTLLSEPLRSPLSPGSAPSEKR